MRKFWIATGLVFFTFGMSFAQFMPSIYFDVEQSCATTSVKSQGRTGTCWSFSTTSFLESEMLRNKKEAIDISEIYTVRNIYLEKAENYVRRNGTVPFTQGSLAHDVIRSYNKYGMMPEKSYSGKKSAIHDHSAMVKELKSYLDTVIKQKPVNLYWKDSFNLLMDKYLGEVPSSIEWNGKQYKPAEFSEKVIGLNMEDYVGITSFTHHPYYQKFVVEVPDNFSNGSYYNVPLNEFMDISQLALEKGYTLEWDGDVSEKGFMARKGLALLLADGVKFDSLPHIPAQIEVTEKNRQTAFDQQTTTDDHLMHITGIAHGPDGKHYFIVKNSWGTKVSFNGYLLMSVPYYAMKTVSIYVHKDALSADIKKKLLID